MAGFEPARGQKPFRCTRAAQSTELCDISNPSYDGKPAVRLARTRLIKGAIKPRRLLLRAGKLKYTIKQVFGSTFVKSAMNIELEKSWPTSIPHLQPERIIARGGFGLVILAKNKRTDQLVAVKILQDKELTPRFLHEAQVVSRLNHENIISLLDYGIDNECPYIVLPYIHGASLRDRMKKGPISWRTAIQFAKNIASGLSHIHLNDIIHRDLKPDNILINNDTCLITDFGISKSNKSGIKTAVGCLLGTPGYIAPETLKEEPYTSASDLYSLGVMLWELIVGVRPHQRAVAFDPSTTRSRLDEMLAIEDTPASPSSIIASCPRWIDNLTHSLLSINPYDRPTALEVVEEVSLHSIPRTVEDTIPA